MKERMIQMTEKTFITAEDAAEILGISKAYASKILQDLNQELKAMGYITISGRVNRQYFLERTCYGSTAHDGRSEVNGCIQR